MVLIKKFDFCLQEWKKLSQEEKCKLLDYYNDVVATKNNNYSCFWEWFEEQLKKDGR